MFSWIATGVLTFFAGLTFWVIGTHSNLSGYGVLACFALASLLMFPPIWQRQTNRRVQIVRYIAAAILAVAALFMPIKTHAVTLDMPSHKSSP